MSQKSYSRRLQRVLCDFAWEESFQGANDRLEEHYGFQVCKERIRACALEHASQIEMEHVNRQPVRVLPGEGASWIVAETDGTMIRVVKTGGGKDRRKERKLEWKEARLAAACEQGCTQAIYEASFGSVEDLGHRWGHAALQAGWCANTQIHVVSDGAPWIREQARVTFGQQSRFTIDLFHVCEYLGAAAPVCAQREKPARWLTRHKNMLLKGKLEKVLENLHAHLEPDHYKDEDAPVRCALRYLENRRDCLDYPFARQQKLPVGSGLIEGGHRNVLHKRLKGPGMSWLLDNAHLMAQARCLKANGQWKQYWSKLAA